MPYHGRDLIIMDATLRALKKQAVQEVEDPIGYVAEQVKKMDLAAKKAQQLLPPSNGSLKQEKGKWVAEVKFLVQGISATNKDAAVEEFRKYIGNQLRDQNSAVRDAFLSKCSIHDGKKPKKHTAHITVVSTHPSGLFDDGKKRWTCEISFRVHGIPAKDKDVAREKFRKYIGNQLRDTKSSVRSQFYKLVTVEEE